MLNRRTLLAAAPALSLPIRARAQGAAVRQPTIRIGSLQDVSGPFADDNGAGTIACIRTAMEEVAGNLDVELLQADHQHKPDVGLAIARQWLDNGVDAIIGFDDSAVALAVSNLVRERDRVLLGTNVAVSTLTGSACTPNATQWSPDTAMLARVLGTALTAGGGDTWFFIRSDYVFGRELQEDTAKIVEAHGGKVVGGVAVPLSTTDFASPLLSAQASKAKVIGFALSGDDLTNCLKQAAEFGVAKGGQLLGAMLIHEKVIHGLGLAATQGITLTGTYYWNLNERTRSFSKRITGNNHGIPPNSAQAGAYAATRHYLRAVAAMGPAAAKQSGRAVVDQMKRMAIEDDVLTNGSIRPDGRMVSDVYLLQTKAPAESENEWDLLKARAKLGPDEAWRPMAEGGCPYVRA